MNLPSTDLRVSLVQAATHWHDAKANRVMYGDLVRPLAGTTDLVVLPETFTSGFTNDTLANAETMDGVTVRWMRPSRSRLRSVRVSMRWEMPGRSRRSSEKRRLCSHSCITTIIVHLSPMSWNTSVAGRQLSVT